MTCDETPQMRMTSSKSSPSYIKLQIQYGSDHYEVHLSSKNDPIRMEQLINEIEKITKVPKCHQTILYKGQRLNHRPEATLDDLHLFNNSKLFVSGTQREYHDKSCCPDHEHQPQSQVKLHASPSISIKSEKSMLTKEIEEQLKPMGFVPEPNKTYE